MTSSDAVTWHQRANDAARSVTALFGRRLLFLPNTHLAAVTWGGAGALRGPRRTLRAAADAAAVLDPWHYWWQAHYLDCLVDTGLRELGGGATPAARFNGPGNPSAGRLASRLVTGIRLRNLFTVVNSYYDDMAWLALATDRLDRLAAETRRPGRSRNARVRRSLTLQFDAAGSDDLGGGVFWSKKRDFKNTPANAPVALHYARTGRPARAQALVDWLDTTLFDPDQHLYLDGARAGTAGEVLVERTIYTYNQGPILGALLELGGDANLARAAALVAAVDGLLTVPAGSGEQGSGEQGRVLRCEGSGDGGLFTGILCRYLALAARDSRLPGQTRQAAARLVLDTAQGFWDGRRKVLPGESARTPAEAVIFSAHASAPAEATFPAGAVVELSTQLQAWMAIEAATTVAAE
ncbi:hypothetical protein NtRootA9_07140 [Arthrobacter sp. NtRootA9]|nr:hypothetical protein NtRootA9_07140 [Arthrobacter sp. NtRootA9]